MNTLTIGDQTVRRDGDAWCITDMWRASGAPKDKRPADYGRSAECASFREFLQLSPDVGNSHVWKTRKIQGGGEMRSHFRRAPLQLRLVPS